VPAGRTPETPVAEPISSCVVLRRRRRCPAGGTAMGALGGQRGAACPQRLTCLIRAHVRCCTCPPGRHSPAIRRLRPLGDPSLPTEWGRFPGNSRGESSADGRGPRSSSPPAVGRPATQARSDRQLAPDLPCGEGTLRPRPGWPPERNGAGGRPLPIHCTKSRRSKSEHAGVAWDPRGPREWVGVYP